MGSQLRVFAKINEMNDEMGTTSSHTEKDNMTMMEKWMEDGEKDVRSTVNSLTKISEWTAATLSEFFEPIEWQDASVIESETIRMIRHFGMDSVATAGIDLQAELSVKVPTTGVYWSNESGMPLLLDERKFSNVKDAEKLSFTKSIRDILAGKEINYEPYMVPAETCDQNQCEIIKGTANAPLCVKEDKHLSVLYDNEEPHLKLDITDFLVD